MYSDYAAITEDIFRAPFWKRISVEVMWQGHCYVPTKSHFLFLLVTLLDNISQCPLQLDKGKTEPWPVACGWI